MHIRKPWRRRFVTSSSGFVRRAPSLEAEAATVCGAAITDRDVTLAEWRRSTRKRDSWGVCPACVTAAAEAA